MRSDTWHVTGDKKPVAARELPSCHASLVTRHAFTLIELLVVISIMGLLAALAVPALKNLGKSNVQASASRQLLDDIGRARQMAISQHTTVYMVFVPTNFWSALSGSTNLNSPATTNLMDKQLTGYNFISLGQVGDQPGQHVWHYLSTWQSLPEGTFIAAAKFFSANYPVSIPIWQSDYAGKIDNWLSPLLQVYAFNTNKAFPFPTETSTPWIPLPFIAFDHKGRLISETADNITFHHAYIPLAQGTVAFGKDLNKQPILTTVLPKDITENPPGSSTNISYNVIDVDPLSGRAKLLVHHLP